MSFGFAGLPIDADLVFDVRFLQTLTTNWNWNLTGQDPAVHDSHGSP